MQRTSNSQLESVNTIGVKLKDTNNIEKNRYFELIVLRFETSTFNLWIMLKLMVIFQQFIKYVTSNKGARSGDYRVLFSNFFSNLTLIEYFIQTIDGKKSKEWSLDKPASFMITWQIDIPVPWQSVAQGISFCPCFCL